MDFEWDPGKAEANRRKHGVDFADAVGVFEDPYALSRPDPFPAEERVATLGRDLLERLIVVVWTWRGEAIRLIAGFGASGTPGSDDGEHADRGLEHVDR